nr:uncharacterized protein LOC106683985 [Halyomorpha halys]
MKYLVLCVVLSYAYAASVDTSKAILQKQFDVFRKCMVVGNVTESEVEVIFKKGEVPEGRKIKCLLGCFMKGMGYVSNFLIYSNI